MRLTEHLLSKQVLIHTATPVCARLHELGTVGGTQTKEETDKGMSYEEDTGMPDDVGGSLAFRGRMRIEGQRGRAP
ncbi:hypothetical protein ACFL6U_22910 [Planctomycetota bacterium]